MSASRRRKATIAVCAEPRTRLCRRHATFRKDRHCERINGKAADEIAKRTSSGSDGPVAGFRDGTFVREHDAAATALPAKLAQNWRE